MNLVFFIVVHILVYVHSNIVHQLLFNMGWRDIAVQRCDGTKDLQHSTGTKDVCRAS
jgi:hypothetical protein